MIIFRVLLVIVSFLCFSEIEEKIENLQALSLKMQSLENGIKYLENEVRKVDDVELKKEQLELLKQKKNELVEFRQLFAESASQTQISYREKFKKPDQKTLSEEIQDILSPVFESVRNASEIPKKMNSLKYERNIFEKHLKELTLGMGKVEELLKNTKHKEMKKELLSTLSHITKEKKEVQILYDSTVDLLEQLESKQESFWKKSSRLFTEFIGNKGKNLLIAISSSFFVLFILLFIKDKLFAWDFVLRNLKQWRTPFQLAFVMISVLISTTTGLMALYLLNDIVLLTISFIIITGIIWSFKSLAPVMIRELRLALNLGSVREGHLIVWRGVPWLILKTGFVSELINPSLSGGKVKVMAKELLDHHSRPVVTGEAWFPSKPGDWVELSDSSFGKVVQQTPENVVLEGLGRQKKYYQTQDFLSFNPINLSEGFRLEVTIGFDYDIQKDINESFRSRLEDFYKEELKTYQKQTKLIQIIFKQAGAHSLDFLVVLECEGSLAPFKKKLEMRIPEVYLKFCNENSLGVPFHQLKVHKS